MAPDETKLDVKDKKILYQLDVNCRQSLGQIAKKVGLSKQVVDYRIKRLEQQGVIKGYITVMDMTKLGYYTWLVYIKYLKPTIEAQSDMINFLKSHSHVAYVVDTYGYWDLVTSFVTRSVSEFFKDWRAFLTKYRNHIAAKDISLIVELSQMRRTYLEGQSREAYDTLVSPAGADVKFAGDKLDWAILKELAGNAKLELQAIAQKVGLSPKAVSYRIKNLAKRGVVQSFRALIDNAKLGYDGYKVFLGLTAMTEKKESELATWLRMYPNVAHMTLAIGQADWGFEFLAHGREDFWKMINELRTKFKDVITTIDVLQYATHHKVLHLPEVRPV